MESVNSIAVRQGTISKLQIKETVLILALSVLIPFLVHFLPDFNGIAVGAVLLPMFWAPYIAVKYFKFHVGLIVALAAPIMNFFITGNPYIAIIPLITIQLAFFVIMSGLLSNVAILKYVNSLLAYIIAIVLSSFVLVVFPVLMPNMIVANYYMSAFVSGLPGIISLVLINYASIKFNRN